MVGRDRASLRKRVCWKRSCTTKRFGAAFDGEASPSMTDLQPLGVIRAGRVT